MDDDSQPWTPRAIVLVAVPTLALTLGIPLANHLEPRILGLPFLLAYIVAWILVTPAFLYAAFRDMQPRA